MIILDFMEKMADIGGQIVCGIFAILVLACLAALFPALVIVIIYTSIM